MQQRSREIPLHARASVIGALGECEKNMEDWMSEEWMCEQGIDLEAQRRELERLKQAQQDRLVAEELRDDLATGEEGDDGFAPRGTEQVRQDRLVAEELQGDLASVTPPREGERACSTPQDAEQVRIDGLVAEELQADVAAVLVPREGERDCSTHQDMDTDKQLSPMTNTLDSSYPPHDLPGPSQRRERMSIEAWTSPPTQRRQSWDETMARSHSSSGSGSCYGTPSELRSRSPISPLTTVTSSTHVPPVSSLHCSPPTHRYSPSSPPHTFPTLSHHSPPSTDSDQKLAEQLQEMEKREREKERERCEKLVNLDHHLAMELMREETCDEEREGDEGGREGEQVLEKMKKRIDMLSQSKTDAEIAMALQEAEKQGGELEGGRVDADLAQRLQSEADKRLEQTRIDEQLALALNSGPSGEDTSHDEELARQIAAQFEATPLDTTTTSASTSQPLLARPPAWWTTCPNCSSDSNCRYHLIEISPGENEWIGITQTLKNAGFTAKRLQRIQNIKLYQRLQFEKESMKTERAEEEDYQLNERLLYHTSSAGVPVICGEGLDQRLSHKGRFGSGVYFRYNILCPLIMIQ